MRTSGILLICLILIGTSCNQAVEQFNTLNRAEKAEGWTLLFDGNSLDQWRSYLKDSLSGWVVEAGTMKGLGLGGDMGGDAITLDLYENFELSLEWKISPKGNSGILYMVHEDTAYHAVHCTGPEYQLIDDIAYPAKLDELKMAGANYAMHPAENKQVKPAGEWNTALIRKDGPLVKHWLNEVKVVEYKLWTDEWEALVAAGKWKNYPGYGRYEKGHISLQDHGAAVWFRNVKIRKL